MKLKELQDLIFSELDIIYGKETFCNVNKYGIVYKTFEDKEVIGLRVSKGGHLEISIK